MAPQKTSIKGLLNPEDRAALEHLYVDFCVPTDQLRRCPDALNAIVAGFERLTSRRIESGVLLRYMFNRRKDKDWPKLAQRARKFKSLIDLLPTDQVVALKEIYLSRGQPSDEYQFRPALMREMAKDFALATGSRESGDVLTAVMVAFRKRGLWPDIKAKTTQAAQPFSDIKEVERGRGVVGA